MRKLIFLSVLVQLYAFHLSAGCQLYLKIYKLPSFEYAGAVKGFDGVGQNTFVFNPSDSIRLHSSHNNSCSGAHTLKEIYFNDSLIFSNNSTSFIQTFTLVCKPGVYRVNTNIAGIPQGYGFTIINSLEVGINEYEQESSRVNLFPNPAHETVNISSEESLKNVLLYNANALLLKEFKPNSSRFSFPINEFPSGIYFVFITTADNKKAVRKFVVHELLK